MYGKRILITGGTGTIGKAFTGKLFDCFPDIDKLIIFSRDEQKHFEMSAEFPENKYPIKYIVGDVRDKDKLIMSCKNIDIILHAAAMKHIPITENNPIECFKTNIIGSQNIIEAAIKNNVERVISISSDKAVLPINAYGASKLYLERLFTDANDKFETKFSIVRYANVFGSKGSVVPFFMKKKHDGFIPITHPDMTRFSITMHESLDLIIFCIKYGFGGEIIIPVSNSYRIVDIAEAIAPGIEKRIIGIRPGEKMHETMIGIHESSNVVHLKNYYIIIGNEKKININKYCSETGALCMPSGFEYISSKNKYWLTVGDIKELIKNINLD